MHRSVLVKEVIEALGVKPGGIYIDGTVGSGGHARAILDATGDAGFVLGMDRDREAIGRAGKALEEFGNRLRLCHGNFADLGRLAGEAGIGAVDGILLDLGVSSDQLETPGRGFSFRDDGPLDMRMDASRGETAADVVSRMSEDELKALLQEYGEEPIAGRIAKAIGRERERGPLLTTGQLADIVVRAYGGKRGRIHPATRVFQALRIQVNDELGALKRGLADGLNLLAVGGRMAVISFHSLEDRLVKRCFAAHAGRWESLPAGGRRWEGEDPAVRWIVHKPREASGPERDGNPRARSAKLRAVERIRRPSD